MSAAMAQAIHRQAVVEAAGIEPASGSPSFVRLRA